VGSRREYVTQDGSGKGHINLTTPFEEFAEELVGRVRVPSVLHQDIEHATVLIHRAPQILALPINRQKDLIEMPLITWSRVATAQLVGIRLPKFPAPFSDRFIRHDHPACEQEIFDITITETEPAVQPAPRADDLGREAVLLVAVDG
jgi:hypothetical protein